MNRMIAASVVVSMAVIVHAAKLDPRLASARKAFVVPADELADDRGVALCFADHLTAKTPMEAVKTKDEAEIILTVRAHLPSATSRFMLGPMGGSPSAHVDASLPDGTKLWDDGAKVRRGNVGNIVMVRGEKVSALSCEVADELLDTLLSAMRKARDKK
jgi:hypothetical protein